ncbi:unnamed protein product [Urochloa decumbens]|uniref:Sulfotransferase n=1 Tax=Urochloa decumbens TaxID=240449 RepID=A0ABC9G6E1_9POAL
MLLTPMAAAAADGDASALVPSGSGPVPFKDIDDGTVPADEHTPRDKDLSSDLVAALPRRQDPIAELLLYQGCWLPKYWVPGVIEFQRRFNPRPDDVVLASYPKCGTTWLMALAFAAAARHAYPPAAAGEHPLRWLHPHDVVPFIDEVFARGEEAKLDALPSPRLMSTHLPFTLLPPRVTAGGGCKVVYVCRDPKDMVVSLWHFLRRSCKPPSKPEDLSFDELFDAVCDGTSALGPAWDHVLSYWRAAVARPDRVLFLRYEDLQRDTGESVRRLAEFMGRPFSAAEEAAGAVAAVVELCSFGNMKVLEVNKNKVDSVASGNLAIPRDAFFRKGVAGDWANHMTLEMAARMDGIFREKLLGTGFSFA